MRSQEGGQAVTLRGLEPGALCAVYCFEAGEAALCAQAPADGEGGARFSLPGDGRIFAVVGDRVALWEEAGGAEENYFRACQGLARLRARQAAQKEQLPVQESMSRPDREPEVSPPEAALEPETEPSRESDGERTEEQATDGAPAPERQEAAAGEALSDAPPSQPAELEEYSLRPAGAGAPVDALPALEWPPAAAELRVYFETLTPIAPFDAPGWRFVRVPSPLRGIPYCAVGYHAQDCRVTQVAYAVPGTPHRAPAALPGYRYQVGRGGVGYWTLWRRVEA